MSEMNSNFSTLHLLVIKELRHERNIHQGLLATAAGKSPGAWSKIENGQSVLTVDSFFGACSALQIAPSAALSIVERLVAIFNMRKVIFHTTSLDASEDELLPLVVSYFNSKGFETLRSQMFSQRISASALGNPFNPPCVPTVVEYCCHMPMRQWIDDGAKTTP